MGKAFISSARPGRVVVDGRLPGALPPANFQQPLGLTNRAARRCIRRDGRSSGQVARCNGLVARSTPSNVWASNIRVF